MHADAEVKTVEAGKQFVSMRERRLAHETIPIRKSVAAQSMNASQRTWAMADDDGGSSSRRIHMALFRRWTTIRHDMIRRISYRALATVTLPLSLPLRSSSSLDSCSGRSHTRRRMSKTGASDRRRKKEKGSRIEKQKQRQQQPRPTIPRKRVRHRKGRENQ